jgi:hypothetical protein
VKRAPTTCRAHQRPSKHQILGHSPSASTGRRDPNTKERGSRKLPCVVPHTLRVKWRGTFLCMPDNPHKKLAQMIREATNGGVDIVRTFSEIYKTGNKRESARAAKNLRDLGLDPDTVDTLAEEELKRRLNARIHPALK